MYVIIVVAVVIVVVIVIIVVVVVTFGHRLQSILGLPCNMTLYFDGVVPRAKCT